MTIPFWLEPESLWDVLYLDGVRVPGICSLDIDKNRSVQVDKSRDENGNTLTDNGYEGAKIKGAIRITHPDELAEVAQLLPRWDPRNPAGVSRPVVVTHPQAQLAGVSSIYAPRWSFPKPSDEELVITFEAVEWFPEPKPVKKAAAGAATSSGGGWFGWAYDAAGNASDAADAAVDQFVSGVGPSGGTTSKPEREPNFDVPPPDPVGEGTATP